MPARSKARKRAVDILFAAEQGGTDPVRTLAEWLERADPPVPEYAADLVRGVTAHRAEIDGLLGTYAEGWTVARMPSVDRTLLRLGAYELLWCPDVPDAVAISEAVTLAGALSTEESPAFVNGLLARLLSLKPEVGASGDNAEPAAVGRGPEGPADRLHEEPVGD